MGMTVPGNPVQIQAILQGWEHPFPTLPLKSKIQIPKSMKATKLSFLVFSATLLGHSQIFAQATWVGTGTVDTPALWSDALNWTGTPPVDNNATSLTFLNSAANSVSSNDRIGLTVTGITIPANDGAVIPVNIKDNAVSGNNITLTGDITVSTGNFQIFALNMDLSTGTRTVNQTTGQTTLSGGLSGTAGITKIGGGTLVLGGDNSYSGETLLSGGSIAVNHNKGLGSTSGGTTVQGASATGGAGRSVFLRNGITVTDESLVLSTASGTRASLFINTTNGVCAWNGNVTVSGGGQTAFWVENMSKMTVGSSSSNTITGDGIASLNLRGSTNPGSGLVNSSINLAGGNLVKNDGAFWTLAGTNTNIGTYTVAGVGTLQLAKTASLHGGITGDWTAAKIIVQNNSTLAFNVGGTGEFSTGDITTLLTNLSASSANGMYGGSRIGFDTSNADSGTFTITDGIVDTTGANGGARGLTKLGPNTLVLAGTNTYTGPTLITGGTLVTNYVSSSVRFTAGAPTSVNGVLELRTDDSLIGNNFASGTFNGGRILVSRATTTDPDIAHTFGALDLSSVTLSVNTGDNITGTAAVSFTELKMTGGNDFNPVTLDGDVDITLGSASITSNGISKRLQLDGTSANNVVTGVISNTNNATTGTPKVNLIKANSSTWHLQGDNTYTGDTTITDGTLKLDFPCLNDASTITIDGVLELAHGQTDTVNKLFIGGVEQAPGLYKAVGALGAGTPIPQLTGTGKLDVLTGVITNAFASWAETNITAIDPLADATSTGDPDGDGVKNLAEFAFNGNPLSGSDNGIVRQFAVDSEDVDTDKELILTIAVRETLPAAPAFSGTPLQLVVAGVTYTVEGGTDFANFNATVTEVAPVTTGLPDLSANPDYEYRSFSLSGSNGLTGKGFLRAKVQD
jgi:autotransporter-associated beta strand protein